MAITKTAGPELAFLILAFLILALLILALFSYWPI
jgi:hypothetical protein